MDYLLPQGQIGSKSIIIFVEERQTGQIAIILLILMENGKTTTTVSVVALHKFKYRYILVLNKPNEHLLAYNPTEILLYFQRYSGFQCDFQCHILIVIQTPAYL